MSIIGPENQPYFPTQNTPQTSQAPQVNTTSDRSDSIIKPTNHERGQQPDDALWDTADAVTDDINMIAEIEQEEVTFGTTNWNRLYKQTKQ